MFLGNAVGIGPFTWVMSSPMWTRNRKSSRLRTSIREVMCIQNWNIWWIELMIFGSSSKNFLCRYNWDCSTLIVAQLFKKWEPLSGIVTRLIRCADELVLSRKETIKRGFSLMTSEIGNLKESMKVWVSITYTHWRGPRCSKIVLLSSSGFGERIRCEQHHGDAPSWPEKGRRRILWVIFAQKVANCPCYVFWIQPSTIQSNLDLRTLLYTYFRFAYCFFFLFLHINLNTYSI